MVIAMRVPVGESIITPRSYCHYCKYTLQPKELIPIISFCIQKGRCTNCKSKISSLYIVFEFVTGSLFFLTVYVIGMERAHHHFIAFFVTSNYFSYRFSIYANT